MREPRIGDIYRGRPGDFHGRTEFVLSKVSIGEYHSYTVYVVDDGEPRLLDVNDFDSRFFELAGEDGNYEDDNS